MADKKIEPGECKHSYCISIINEFRCALTKSGRMCKATRGLNCSYFTPKSKEE